MMGLDEIVAANEKAVNGSEPEVDNSREYDVQKLRRDLSFCIDVLGRIALSDDIERCKGLAAGAIVMLAAAHDVKEAQEALPPDVAECVAKAA